MEEKEKTVTQTETQNEKEKTEETVTQTENKTEGESEKTFTQEEVNALLKKERKKIPDKEELEKFKSWQESQKTEAQKQSEFNQKLTDTTNENIALKQENQVLKSGVNTDDVDYVVFKVSKMEGDFEDNLKDFLKENPKYLQKEERGSSKEDSGTSVTRIKDSLEDGAVTILKNKHPDLFK